ncbi:MAG: MarR family winged helix-turn-helix transcriptional regulator [Bacteroidota bacterium]
MNVNPESQSQINQLEERLIDLNQVIRQHREYIKTKYKLTALEMELIQFVAHNGPQKMKEVSENFYIKLSTLTSIIDKAEKKKILKRSNSKQDRRVVYLEITKNGRKLFEAYQGLLKHTAKRMEAELGKEKFQAFVGGMEIFARMSIKE